MISINATLILQVIHFLIMVFILNRLMFRPILKVMRKRQDHVQQTKEEISLLEQEVQKMWNEFTDREQIARREASHERAELRHLGTTHAEEFLNESREKVVAMRAKADEAAGQEINRARPLLQHAAGDLAEDIIEKVVGRRIPG